MALHERQLRAFRAQLLTVTRQIALRTSELTAVASTSRNERMPLGIAISNLLKDMHGHLQLVPSSLYGLTDRLYTEARDLDKRLRNPRGLAHHLQAYDNILQTSPPYNMVVAWQEWYNPINHGAMRSGEQVLRELLAWSGKHLATILYHAWELRKEAEKLRRFGNSVKTLTKEIDEAFKANGVIKPALNENSAAEVIASVIKVVRAIG